VNYRDKCFEVSKQIAKLIGDRPPEEPPVIHFILSWPDNRRVLVTASAVTIPDSTPANIDELT
jgi:hypothetical protein